MIWCLEDDTSIRDILVYALNSTGSTARGFEKPSELWTALENEIPELLILDIMLPDEDGVSILGKLKSDARTSDIPVIMATAKGMEFDKVKCLELGADDYLVKPFGMMEMVARVKAVLRRSKKTEVVNTLSLGELTVNVNERSIYIGDSRINLTYKEFELLRLFLSNPRQVFTRDQLYDSIWGSDYMGESRTVDMHIKTLRQKLGDYGYIIGTVRNVGYRLEERKDDR